MDVLMSVGDIFEHMATQHKKMHIAYNRHDWYQAHRLSALLSFFKLGRLFIQKGNVRCEKFIVQFVQNFNICHCDKLDLCELQITKSTHLVKNG